MDNETEADSKIVNRWETGYYNLFHKRPGYCPGKFIIFNHFEFKEDLGLSERDGTHADANRIEKTFKTLGFQEAAECQLDLTSDEIQVKLEYVINQKFDDCGCIIVVILTHGESGKLYAKDKTYELDELKMLFKEDDAAKKFAGKPKIFLIQACQGNEADPGVEVVCEYEEAAVGDSGMPEESNVRIALMSDFLTALGTTSGYVSFRDPKNGSWFIQSLCDAIDEFGDKKHFESILTLVKYDIAYNRSSFSPKSPEIHNKKQVPEVTSTLTKLLYFTEKAVDYNKDENLRRNKPALETGAVKNVSQCQIITDSKSDISSPMTSEDKSSSNGNLKDQTMWFIICIIATFISAWFMFCRSQPEYHFHCYPLPKNPTEG